MSAVTTKLSHAQFALTRYLRNPDEAPVPAEFEQRRLDVYSELIFNNIEGFLSSGFPILHRLVAEDVWLKLVRLFIADYRAETPYFLEIGQGFLQFVQGSSVVQQLLPVFAQELMHYEWVELALDVSPNSLPVLVDHGPVNKATRVQLSSLAWPLAYQFPVQSIGPNFQPTDIPEQPTFLLVHRDRLHQVKFTALNGLSYALLEAADVEGGKNLAELASQLYLLVHGHQQDAVPDVFIEQAFGMVQRFVDQDILHIC